MSTKNKALTMMLAGLVAQMCVHAPNSDSESSDSEWVVVEEPILEGWSETEAARDYTSQEFDEGWNPVTDSITRSTEDIVIIAQNEYMSFLRKGHELYLASTYALKNGNEVKLFDLKKKLQTIVTGLIFRMRMPALKPLLTDDCNGKDIPYFIDTFGIVDFLVKCVGNSDSDETESEYYLPELMFNIFSVFKDERLLENKDVNRIMQSVLQTGSHYWTKIKSGLTLQTCIDAILEGLEKFPRLKEESLYIEF